MATTILALVLLLLAVVLAAVGVAGIAGRLPRNRWLGFRGRSVGASDEAWRVGHRAAGPTLIAAAGLPLLLAAALLAIPPEHAEEWFLVYALVGVVTGALIALASRQAQRAVDQRDVGRPGAGDHRHREDESR